MLNSSSVVLKSLQYPLSQSLLGSRNISNEISSKEGTKEVVSSYLPALACLDLNFSTRPAVSMTFSCPV